MALITLSEYKTYKGISGSSEDTVLASIVAAVNAAVENYVGRILEATTYTAETYDGPGGNALRLNNYPIISVTTVTCEDETLTALDLDDRLDGDKGYWIKDNASGILWNNNVWPRGRGIIEITYEAGYETIPDDLKHACYLIADYYRNINGKSGIISESLGAYGYSLDNRIDPFNQMWSIPNFALVILNKYKEPYTSGVY